VAGHVAVRGSDNGEHRAEPHLLPGLDEKLGDHARGGRRDPVLHLHRLQPQQRRAIGHLVAGSDGHPGNRAGHRRKQRPRNRLLREVGEPGHRSERDRAERRVDTDDARIAGHQETPPDPRLLEHDGVRCGPNQPNLGMSVGNKAATGEPVADLVLAVLTPVALALRVCGDVAPAAGQLAARARAVSGGVCERGGQGADRLVAAAEQRFGQCGQPVRVEECGVGVTGEKRGVSQHPHQQVPVGAQTVQPASRQRGSQSACGLRPCVGERDHLGQHRVVVHADDRATVHPGVQPQPRSGERTELGVHPRNVEPVQRAALWLPAARRVSA
jgi:hypothetical protein